jgi:hypothetical protein
MTQYGESWKLSRGRFVDSLAGLSSEQLNYRLHGDALSIGESALHVFGAEVSFCSQLTGKDLDEFGQKLKISATDGVVNDSPFPFSAEQITPETIAKAEAYAKSIVEPLITEPSDEVLNKEIKSVLGPIVTGAAAFARLAFHPAYHHGQVYLICTAPNFPK